MNRYHLFIIVIITLFVSSCDEISNSFEDLFGRDPDPLITEQDALAQNYNLTTPKYGIQVAIDQDVDASTQQVLTELDTGATAYFECQYAEGEDVGFGEFEIEGGEIIPPMSELMIYVVPFSFECNAVDTDICAGIHFNNSGIIVIAEESIGTCSDFALLEHEIAHRYGLEADHDNLEEFEACTSPPQCDFSDFIDIGIGG